MPWVSEQDMISLVAMLDGGGGGAKGGWWTQGKGKGKGKGKGFSQKGKGKSWGPMQQAFSKKKAGVNPNNPNDWVSALGTALAKKLKRPLTKTDLQYSIDEVGENEFVAVLVSEEFVKLPIYTGDQSSSKVDAKKNAARVAMESEFPEAFEDLKGSMNKSKVAPKANAKFTAQPKKKSPPATSTEKPAKTLLYESLSLFFGRPVAKSDLTWEVEEADGTFSVVLAIPEVSSGTFTALGGTKKEAETIVSLEALKLVEPVADEKRAEAIENGTKKRKRTPEEKAKAKALQDKLKSIDNSKKVWVGGINESVTEGELKAFFSKAGTVQMTSKLHSDTSAVVVFKSAGEAAKSISMLNGQTIGLGNVIEVDKWGAKAVKKEMEAP